MLCERCPKRREEGAVLAALDLSLRTLEQRSANFCWTPSGGSKTDRSVPVSSNVPSNVRALIPPIVPRTKPRTDQSLSAPKKR